MIILAASLPVRAAYVIDGFVDDWGINLSAANNAGYLDTHLPSGVSAVTEDNTDASTESFPVGPGASNYNSCDAEAMYADTDANNLYLAVISGTPETGVPSGNLLFMPGDIAFDMNRDGVYEYGLNIRDKGLYAVASWNNVLFTEFSAANPWTVKTGTLQGLIGDFCYSGNQNSHYVIEAKIPFSLLDLSGPLDMHWTMQCGNDSLDLAVDPVPEPSTLLLMFMGIAGSVVSFVRRKYHRLRRGFDILISSLGLIITFPLLLVAAVLVKLDSPGPVFYKQVRVGLNRRGRRNGSAADREQRKDNLFGKPFTIYKLRTMRCDAETGTGAVWASKNDSRITRIGWLLRKTRIDEIPQFINVLKGDMSFIGPRPERPEFVKKLNKEIRYYHRRFDVKPGLTGLAQVRYEYASSVKDTRKKLKYDLLYARKMCLNLDTQIIADTLSTVLLAKGAH